MTAVNIPPWLPGDPRKRRWIAVALFFLLIGIIIAAVVVPAALLHRRYDDNIAKLVRQLNNQTAFNALRPRLTEKLALLKARDVKKMFLKGASSALALAELQEMVRATIDTNGGRVMNSSSVQGSTPKDEGPYRQVAATFTLNANNVNLRRVLYALETSEPYLFIDSVVIQPQISSGFRPTPGSAEPEMFVQLDVRAFALKTTGELVTPQTGTGATSGLTAVKRHSADVTTRDKAGAA